MKRLSIYNIMSDTQTFDLVILGVTPTNLSRVKDAIGNHEMEVTNSTIRVKSVLYYFATIVLRHLEGLGLRVRVESSNGKRIETTSNYIDALHRTFPSHHDERSFALIFDAGTDRESTFRNLDETRLIQMLGDEGKLRRFKTVVILENDEETYVGPLHYV